MAIFIIIAIAILLFAVIASKKSTKVNASLSDVSMAPPSIASPFIDTIEDQDLYTCIARYIGAIITIRDHCTWRSWMQGGCVQVTRNENGTYHIHGHYDHDSNYDVQNTLQRGGYLDYHGMRYVDEGFSYQVDDIKPKCERSFAAEDSMLVTDKYIMLCLRERFGTSVNIKVAWTKGNSTFVSFNFHE